VHPPHRSREGPHNFAGRRRCLHGGTVQLPDPHHAGKTGGRLRGVPIRGRDQEGIAAGVKQSPRHAEQEGLLPLGGQSGRLDCSRSHGENPYNKPIVVL